MRKLRRPGRIIAEGDDVQASFRIRTATWGAVLPLITTLLQIDWVPWPLRKRLLLSFSGKMDADRARHKDGDSGRWGGMGPALFYLIVRYLRYLIN